MATPAIGPSGYAFTVTNLGEASKLGLGALCRQIKKVQKQDGAQEGDVLDFAKNCKGKAREMGVFSRICEAIRLYVKMHLFPLLSRAYENTLGQAKKFATKLVERTGGDDALENGMDKLGQELQQTFAQRAEGLVGKQDESSDAKVEEELGRDTK